MSLPSEAVRKTLDVPPSHELVRIVRAAAKISRKRLEKRPRRLHWSKAKFRAAVEVVTWVTLSAVRHARIRVSQLSDLVRRSSLRCNSIIYVLGLGTLVARILIVGIP